MTATLKQRSAGEILPMLSFRILPALAPSQSKRAGKKVHRRIILQALPLVVNNANISLRENCIL